MTAVCNANVIGQLEKWVDANRRSGITNMVRARVRVRAGLGSGITNMVRATVGLG